MCNTKAPAPAATPSIKKQGICQRRGKKRSPANPAIRVLSQPTIIPSGGLNVALCQVMLSIFPRLDQLLSELGE